MSKVTVTTDVQLPALSLTGSKAERGYVIGETLAGSQGQIIPVCEYLTREFADTQTHLSDVCRGTGIPEGTLPYTAV